MKFSFSKNQKRLIYGMAFSGLIIVFALLVLPFSPTFIGGTSWGFDYQFNSLVINGEIQGIDDLPGYIDETVEGGGEGDFGIALDVRTPYEWWVDVDGDPLYTGTEWTGLAPDIGVTASLPWRVDVNGVKVANSYEDPLAPAYEVGEEIHKIYYYAFDVLVKTAQSQFSVPATAQSLWQPWQSAECGVMDVDTVLTVAMLKRFPDDVIGEFMDCKVLDVEMQDIQLQSGLQWEVTPSMAPKQDINQGIPISNRDPGDEFYSCDLLFTATLTPGLVRSGDNLLPYDVYIRKAVQMSLLLKAPLKIGETGEPQDPFSAPVFVAPMDPFTMILIIMALIIVIIILIVIFRALGVIGSVAKVLGMGKDATN